MMKPNKALGPTAVGAFRLATVRHFSPPLFGGSAGFSR
jgi:hypothetical protein